MSNRASGGALKGAVAFAAVVAASAALSGCSTMGSAFRDPTVTGSTAYSGSSNLNQPMPQSLGASTQVAENQFIPPMNVGGGGGMVGGGFVSSSQPTTFASAPQAPLGSVSTEDLPVLTSNSSGSQTAMPAQQSLAPAKTTLGTLPSTPAAPPALKPTAVANANPNQPNLAVVPSNAYVHVVEGGESLYTIARRYDVTAQAILTANGSFSPDKLYVGQKLVIPGRPDLLSQRGATQVAALGNPAAPAITQPAASPQKQVAAITDPGVLKSGPAAPAAQTQANAAQTLQTAAVQPSKPAPVLQEPAMSGADKFRWPITGKIITNFAASKGTGINIEAPEGAAIRAAENGTVIYVGSGVEGYGNLVLIRHANGYVSAYAHLKTMSVAKGDVVNRGDTIGAAGMTGSVSRPQLHFELRKGATPVDPVPMLAG